MFLFEGKQETYGIDRYPGGAEAFEKDKRDYENGFREDEDKTAISAGSSRKLRYSIRGKIWNEAKRLAKGNEKKALTIYKDWFLPIHQQYLSNPNAPLPEDSINDLNYYGSPQFQKDE